MSAQTPRDALRCAVTEARRLLVGDRRLRSRGDLDDQLEAPYGFDPGSGEPRDLGGLSHLAPRDRAVAGKLRLRHAQLLARAPTDGAVGAYEQMKAELGYTELHRLAALRMAEEREVMPCTVGRGMQSDGFRTWLKFAPDFALGDEASAYTCFLDRVYDELAVELPAIFDRTQPELPIRPSPRAIASLLEILNQPALDTLWRGDEDPEDQADDTIGWLFEDWNNPDERREMRESDIPQTTRELAVRNQFFTPRWVVRFLTENTLGRVWLHHCPDSRLAQQQGTLLVPPADAEERPRDPRTLRVLDPACGSGHFLLYAYDLLETIYLEAWEGQRQRSKGMRPLWIEFKDGESFRREIPRLILKHNLYGVDIDPRCVQAAALSLWLRAQRSWREQGIRGRDRPRLDHMNLVTATALSADPERLASLAGRLGDPLLSGILTRALTTAGGTGLLVKPEAAVAEAAREARRAWVASRDARRVQVDYLEPSTAGPAEGEPAGLDAAFWADAQKKVEAALAALLDEAADGDFRDRLFANDIQHGLALFELGQLQYDAILMNPPFGDPIASTKATLDKLYEDAGHDLFAMFYLRGLELLADGGRIGAITSRAWLALPKFTAFRDRMLGQDAGPEVVADLGYGVLNAKVETAAAVFGKGVPTAADGVWARLVKTRRKRQLLPEVLDAARAGRAHPALFRVATSRFAALPGRICGYWMSPTLMALYRGTSTVGAQAEVKQGTATADDFRFLRMGWEVDPARIGLDLRWARYAKGGEYRPWFDDVYLVLNWEGEGKELAAYPKAYIRNPGYYGRPGVTWPRRTNFRIAPRALPADCAFGDKAPTAFPSTQARATLLSVLNSAPTFLLLAPRLQTADDSPNAISKSYEVGLVKGLPWPSLTDTQSNTLRDLARLAVETNRLGQLDEDESGETALAFALPSALLTPDGTLPSDLRAAAHLRAVAREDRCARLAEVQAKVDAVVADAYGLTETDRAVMREDLEPPLALLPQDREIADDLFAAAYLSKDAVDGGRLPGGLDAESDVRVEHRRKKQHKSLRSEATLSRLFDAHPSVVAATRRRLGLLRDEDQRAVAADLVSWAVGVAFGRWDVRLWQHPDWIPRFQDPFAAMPVCPLGQLVNHKGLPATADQIASPDWMRARAALAAPTLPEGRFVEITARDYPLPVAWDGVLVDDLLVPEARDGFVARVSAVLDLVLSRARPSWDVDLCQALGVVSLAEWLRDPDGFFDDHLARYTKKPRQAPIYWPLSTSEGDLVYWVYAPRWDQRLFSVVLNRLRELVDRTMDDRDHLLAQVEHGGNAAVLARHEQTKRAVAAREQLLRALVELERKGYRPHSDDGYVITASPLRGCFRHAKWSEKLDEAWSALIGGDCEWAHLALALWPERVTERCRVDRSVAIAHGREDIYAAPAPAPKTRKATAAKQAPTAGVQVGLPMKPKEET